MDQLIHNMRVTLLIVTGTADRLHYTHNTAVTLFVRCIRYLTSVMYIFIVYFAASLKRMVSFTVYGKETRCVGHVYTVYVSLNSAVVGLFINPLP